MQIFHKQPVSEHFFCKGFWDVRGFFTPLSNMSFISLTACFIEELLYKLCCTYLISTLRGTRDLMYKLHSQKAQRFHSLEHPCVPCSAVILCRCSVCSLPSPPLEVHGAVLLTTGVPLISELRTCSPLCPLSAPGPSPWPPPSPLLLLWVWWL